MAASDRFWWSSLHIEYSAIVGWIILRGPFNCLDVLLACACIGIFIIHTNLCNNCMGIEILPWPAYSCMEHVSKNSINTVICFWAHHQSWILTSKRNTLSGNLSGFLLYILETREYCDVIKVLLHSKFSDHVTRAWLSILMTSHYSRVSKIYSNLPSTRHS